MLPKVIYIYSALIFKYFTSIAKSEQLQIKYSKSSYT